MKVEIHYTEKSGYVKDTISGVNHYEIENGYFNIYCQDGSFTSVKEDMIVKYKVSL